MDWKEFFKLNWTKVGITSIVLLISTLFTQVPAFVVMKNGDLRFQFIDYTYFLSHFTKWIYFDYELLTFGFVLLEIILIYAIACLFYSYIKKILSKE